MCCAACQATRWTAKQIKVKKTKGGKTTGGGQLLGNGFHDFYGIELYLQLLWPNISMNLIMCVLLVKTTARISPWLFMLKKYYLYVINLAMEWMIGDTFHGY